MSSVGIVKYKRKKVFVKSIESRVKHSLISVSIGERVKKNSHPKLDDSKGLFAEDKDFHEKMRRTMMMDNFAGAIERDEKKLVPRQKEREELEAIKQIDPRPRVLFCLSGEVFGLCGESNDIRVARQ